METITGIDLTVSGSPSLIMRDLSQYATLAFLAAFDVPQEPNSTTPLKRITYIALSKKTMPLLVDLFVKYRDMAEIYVDGTLESVLSVRLSTTACDVGTNVNCRRILYRSSLSTTVRQLRNSGKIPRFGRLRRRAF